MAAPFVLVLPDGTIGGYYTLSATGVKLTEFPTDITRKLPRYPSSRRRFWAGWPSIETIKGEGTAAFYSPTLCSARSVVRSPRSPLSSMLRMRRPTASMSGRASCRFLISP